MGDLLPSSVEIVEVGPRDGLQDEPLVVPTDRKLAYIAAAVGAGVRRIEVASFAHPTRVPQMADAEAVIAGLDHADDVSYIGLVMNARGMDRAIASGIGEVNTVVIVTDSFSQENQGMSSREAVAMAADVAGRARQSGIRVGVTLSAAFGCPYEGVVDPDHVVHVAMDVAAAGVDELSLADTIGCAVPNQTEDLTAAVRTATGLPVRVHLHNSRNTGLANAVAALAGGATALDSSLGGIGGCPFAPGATGNVPTEDLAHMLARMGVDTGLDVPALLDAVSLVEAITGHPAAGMLSRAGFFPRRV
jgi:hydroxymethylglutaryl-CoA lyase